MGLLDIFKAKGKPPEPEAFMTAAGPTRQAAGAYERAKEKYAPSFRTPKADARQKPTVVKITTAMPFVATERQKGIFDPSRPYPTMVPYWAKQKKRVI